MADGGGSIGDIADPEDSDNQCRIKGIAFFVSDFGTDFRSQRDKDNTQGGAFQNQPQQRGGQEKHGHKNIGTVAHNVSCQKPVGDFFDDAGVGQYLIQPHAGDDYNYGGAAHGSPVGGCG